MFGILITIIVVYLIGLGVVTLFGWILVALEEK